MEVYHARRVHVQVVARTAVDVPAVPAVPMAARQAVAARTAAARTAAVAEAAVPAVAVVAMVVHRAVAVVVANQADIQAHTLLYNQC